MLIQQTLKRPNDQDFHDDLLVGCGALIFIAGLVGRATLLLVTERK